MGAFTSTRMDPGSPGHVGTLVRGSGDSPGPGRSQGPEEGRYKVPARASRCETAWRP